MEASCNALRNEGGVMNYKEVADNFTKRLTLKAGVREIN